MPFSDSRTSVKRLTSRKLDEMVDDLEGFDSDEPIEKDETEIELEKLVFGDESGFHEGLKSYKDASTDLRDLVDGDWQQAQDALEQGKLEGLDDANVKLKCLSDLLSLNILPALLSRLHSVRCECPGPFTPLKIRSRDDAVRGRQRRGMGR